MRQFSGEQLIFDPVSRSLKRIEDEYLVQTGMKKIKDDTPLIFTSNDYSMF